MIATAVAGVAMDGSRWYWVVAIEVSMRWPWPVVLQNQGFAGRLA